MANIKSKNAFIEKLSFYLSLHFTDEEAADVLNDYEEWFENETSQNKSEQEICRALTPPKKIVQNLLEESGGGPIQISVLFQNTTIQVLLLIILHLLMNLFWLRLCGGNSTSYLYFALGINLLYFLSGYVIIKKSRTHKPRSCKNNLPVSGMAVLIILLEIFLLPNLSAPNSGKICVVILSMTLFFLFSANIYYAIRKSISDKQSAFLTTLHICGLITLLLFLICQFHALWSDASEYLNLIYGSLGIYAETVILCALFYNGKMHSKENI